MVMMMVMAAVWDTANAPTARAATRSDLPTGATKACIAFSVSCHVNECQVIVKARS